MRSRTSARNRPRDRRSRPPAVSRGSATGSADWAGWSAAHFPPTGGRRERQAGILSVGVKVVINLFCHSLADAGDALNLGDPGACDGARRAEMMQQRLLAAGADPGNLIERRAADRL